MSDPFTTLPYSSPSPNFVSPRSTLPVVPPNHADTGSVLLSIASVNRLTMTLAADVSMSRVRSAFFCAVSAVFLCAFASLYTQIQGLYGDSGVLPVRAFAQLDTRGPTALLMAFTRVPSLVWLGPSIGLSLNSTLDVVALTGTAVSFLQLVTPKLRTTSFYFLLVVLYFSLMQVGQTFMWFQWDTLLLEAGLLTAVAAPLDFPLLPRTGPHSRVSFWLLRWLLFRLMFASGAVKLTSDCPTWWGLTALNVHFESQCLPTPLAWHAHHLPVWLLRMSVVGTYLIEIVVPFLFFAPVNKLRLFAFASQILLQVCIMLTGNYNFFNVLTMALCLSVLKDDHFDSSPGKRRFSVPSWLQSLLSLFVFFSLAYWTVRLFDVKFVTGTITFRTAFDKPMFQTFLHVAVPLSIVIGSASLLCNILIALSEAVRQQNVLSKVRHSLTVVVVSCLAVFLFGASLVPFTSLDHLSSARLWPVVRRWHKQVDGFNVVNSYGLFRRMTGLSGRPELVLEGSDDLKSGWKEFHFRYKPGDVAEAPKFLMPHQPRLDWQMWFAALDHYQNNPWLLQLAYRLLTNQREVLDLLDKQRLPFDKPPKYVRARLYSYRYTEPGSKDWWRRSEAKDYFQPVSRESLKDFLIQNGVAVDGAKFNDSDQQPVVVSALKWIRETTAQLTPPTFIFSLLTSALLVSML